MPLSSSSRSPCYDESPSARSVSMRQELTSRSRLLWGDRLRGPGGPGYRPRSFRQERHQRRWPLRRRSTSLQLVASAVRHFRSRETHPSRFEPHQRVARQAQGARSRRLCNHGRRCTPCSKSHDGPQPSRAARSRRQTRHSLRRSWPKARRKRWDESRSPSQRVPRVSSRSRGEAGSSRSRSPRTEHRGCGRLLVWAVPGSVSQKQLRPNGARDHPTRQRS